MQNNQAFFETLFNRNFSDKGNEEYLKEITAAHPYFSPAQFYMLLLTEKGTAQYSRQANKTNIFFNNPHWLNFQLQQTDEPDLIVEGVESLSAVSKVAVDNNIVETTEVENIAEVEKVDEIEEVAEVEIAEVAEVEKTKEIPEPEKEPTAETAFAEPITQSDNQQPDNRESTEYDEHYQQEPEIEPMKIELKIPELKTNLSEAMLFEPMHMVDYFASQGIKLSEDVQNGDKLGKQLKSFTEWLKTMKKIHVENEPETTVDTGTVIQTLAENSNLSAEVLTESMADVFVKQGKTAKASELYQKLSLLNPAKSAYFAAKIENLKEI